MKFNEDVDPRQCGNPSVYHVLGSTKADFDVTILKPGFDKRPSRVAWFSSAHLRNQFLSLGPRGPYILALIASSLIHVASAH